MEGPKNPFIGVVRGNTAILSRDPVQSIGDLPSGSELCTNQRLVQLERWLKEQQNFHHQQLASFLVVNASLHEENASVQNAIPSLPRSHSTAHRMDALTSRLSPMQSESTNNFPPPRHQPRRHGGLSWGERRPSPRRNLDPTLWALNNISVSLFVHAILNQEAPPLFTFLKFLMYDGLQDPFDHLMHYR